MSGRRAMMAKILLLPLWLACSAPGWAQQVPAPASSSAQAPAPMAPAKPAVGSAAMAGMHDGAMPGMQHADTSAADHASMSEMDHAPMPAMDHAAMDHGGMSGMDHTAMPKMDHGAMPEHAQGEMTPSSHAVMPAMDMRSMQGGSAPANARDPDYSDGISFKPDKDVHMHGDARHAMLLLDRLEYFDARDSRGVSLDAQGWYGGDTNKLWLKVEGEHSEGRVESLRTEALWSHAVAAYWDTQVGLRHDAGIGPSRDWVAFGVQGLAPYWLEAAATVYAGTNGHTAARAEVEYEVLFTQRLILTPRVEVNLYGKEDPARGIGQGLSDAEFGLRLRYEIRRRFAPYVGISWSRRFGTTADFARRDGRAVSDRQIVAGIRIWL